MLTEAPAESGSTMSKAERSWEEADASTSRRPSFPVVCRVNGKPFAAEPSGATARQPAARRASSRPRIGRARMASSPSSSYEPPGASARKAVRNRAAVPALPTWSFARSRGMRPPRPTIRTVPAGSSSPTSKPSARRAAMRIRVSRLKRAPEKTVTPSARAARMSARLVMLFEPGTWATPRAGVVKGRMTRAGLMRAGPGPGGRRAPRRAGVAASRRRPVRWPCAVRPRGVRARGAPPPCAARWRA